MRTCAVERVLPHWPSIGDFRTDLARRRTSKKALKFRYSVFDRAGLLTRKTDESDKCRRRQTCQVKAPQDHLPKHPMASGLPGSNPFGSWRAILEERLAACLDRLHGRCRPISSLVACSSSARWRQRTRSWTRSCARPTAHSTRTRCARLSPWTGRRSPGHCARSGCGPSADPRGRWPPPPISICGRGRPRWTPGTRHGSAGAGWHGPDRRFAAPEWQDNPIYRTLKELYLLASDWLLRQASEGEDLSPAEQQHLDFHLRQFVDAMSPTRLLVSNPVALRRAVETGGASLAEGMRNLMHDLKEGRLSMVDAEAFAPGRNLALSPGKVVYRNKLIELIQYEPKGETVHRVPLLILPPWINKYYLLDLQPKNSMVRYLVEQGFTVFMVSWRNPDTSMEGTTIEDYVDLGPLAASDVVREIT